MIVYELFVGKFDIEKKLILPADLDATTKDLLQQLFQMNRNKILGYKHDDVASNYRELKSHPFFEGVDFKQIEPTEVNEELREAFDNAYVEQQQQRRF